MYKKLLNDFFKKNGVEDPGFPSVAAMANFQIKLLQQPDICEEFQEIFNEAAFSDQPERKEEALAEKKEIEFAVSYKEIVRFMRRGIDTINQPYLVKKAVEFEEELVPDVIRRLKTNLDTGFIEIAARVLSVCNMNIAEELVEYFDDVRNPYAQSMILIVLGFKSDETHIPWIIEKHHQLKKLYPNESFSESAIYALWEIENRFY